MGYYGMWDPNPMGYYGTSGPQSYGLLWDVGTPRDLWAIMGCAPLWVGTHWQCGPAVDTLQWPLLQSMVWAVLGAQAVTQRTVGPEVTA